MKNNDTQIKRLEAHLEKVNLLFDDYRKSGISLSATVIGLASGGFYGLFKIESTKELSFLYLIPISISLMQQLAHYLGSKSKADSELQAHVVASTLVENENDAEELLTNWINKRRYSDFYFGLSDIFSVVSVLSLGLTTILPITLFGSSLVSVIFSVVIGWCLVLWAYKFWKAYKASKPKRLGG